MCNLKVLSLLLLGSCGVLVVLAESVASEETTIKNDAGVTLSTELQPPPLPPAGEHRGIVYLINLFAVKNKTGDESGENAQNALTDDSPEVIGPLASILLFVDDDDDDGGDDLGDDEVTLDDLTKISVEEDYADGVSSTEDVKKPKEDTKISEKSNVAEDKSKNSPKNRSKRTLKRCKKCGGGGGGGGGGYERDYDNYYSSGGSSGRNVGVIPIVLAIPVDLQRGQRGHRNGNYGGQRRDEYHSNNGGGQEYGYHYNNGGYPNSGGNENYHYPSSNNGHPYGGGNYYPTGGSNAQSQASAQAQASGSGQGYGQAQSQAQAQAQASSGR